MNDTLIYSLVCFFFFLPSHLKDYLMGSTWHTHMCWKDQVPIRMTEPFLSPVPTNHYISNIVFCWLGSLVSIVGHCGCITNIILFLFCYLETVVSNMILLMLFTCEVHFPQETRRNILCRCLLNTFWWYGLPLGLFFLTAKQSLAVNKFGRGGGVNFGLSFLCLFVLCSVMWYKWWSPLFILLILVLFCMWQFWY